MTETKVVNPLGFLSGEQISLPLALKLLAIELLGHRSDLQQLATDNRKSKSERECLQLRATDLERYGVALYSLAVQADKEQIKDFNRSTFAELARQHGINLPDWLSDETNDKPTP